MIKNKIVVLVVFLFLVVITFSFFTKQTEMDRQFVSYTVDAKKQNIKLYWKGDNQSILKSIQKLKTFTESKQQTLVFATNAGMYKIDNSPQGLFIDDTKLISTLDTTTGNGNFYLKPNGVFYITTSNEAQICVSEKFKISSHIKYATQSGPMLLIDGNIHSAFKPQSKNFNIRNGVGILPNGNAVFAMSKNEINFYDFANYFKKLGCKHALYLDGFVSRCYLPEKKWVQLDGNFGVMIGVTKKN